MKLMQYGHLRTLAKHPAYHAILTFQVSLSKAGGNGPAALDLARLVILKVKFC